MFVYSVLFSILVLLLIRTKGQHHLYYTDPTRETNLYYDCLHYKTLDEIVTNSNLDILQSFHQIISYCKRPLSKMEQHEENFAGSTISSNFTFEMLQKQNVTAADLFLWSAPIDLIERYQNYLDTPTLVSASELFYNCTLLWFGSFCQYTFDSNEPFSEIVRKTFIAKNNNVNEISILDVTNLTCYMFLECNRGPAPACLDWREICDGRIDCLGNGIDEKHCLDLELNECEQNEYRCHNGMCIPEQFVNDSPGNPDCLDQTDENDDEVNRFRRLKGFEQCYQNPVFLCEESDPFFGYRGFVCGDGQQIKIGLPEQIRVIDTGAGKFRCSNRRDLVLLRSIVGNALLFSNLTDECQLVMSCITFGDYGINCIRQRCERQNFPCSLRIQNECSPASYVMLPVLPVIQNYALFGYWTNNTITYEFPGWIPHPDFVCYDARRCPFFLPNFQINSMACSNMPNISGIANFYYTIAMFHTCLPVDESGNETDCFHPSLFHCPNVSKCISKHRLLDGVADCPDGADEGYIESCNLNHRHRFRCASENKCISPVVVRDLNNQCQGGEDEHFSYEQKVPFQNLCNGYTHLPAVFMDGQNETDETNCEQWPCNNQYTQCDGAWTCSNGADEVNCDPTARCYPNHHECVSPTTLKMICLSMDQAGNGKVDCLGAIDEREYCRRVHPTNPLLRYQCWNDTLCTFSTCGGLNDCRFERTNLVQKLCEEDEHVTKVFQSLFQDFQLGSVYNQAKKYFTLHNMSRFRWNASFTRLPVAGEPSSTSASHMSRIPVGSSAEILPKEINFRDAWMCNRGIMLFAGIQKSEHCLCPPSYYGNRCQFQHQRVSLTLQFSKECAPFCHGVYGIVLTLIDNEQEIHSYEQLTYISTSNCDMKYNLYFLYRSRPKNLAKNYTIRIDAYNKIDLTYYASWILPVKFLFLPVNRMAAYLIIPAHPVGVPDNCPLICGDHGYCAVYANTGEYFCRCNSKWSGENCAIRHDDCDCSPESICLGKVDNRYICLCPPNKSGPRCFIHSICRDNPCKNAGQCIPEDTRISINTFTCICSSGYSARICNVTDTRIEISFSSTKIPQSLLVHFVTVQREDDPLINTIAKKVTFDQDSTVLYTSLLFNMIFIQIDTEFYLAFLQDQVPRLADLALKMETFHHCAAVQNLFADRMRAFPLLRRAKYYHVLCREHSQLSCLHDNEAFMCLCNEDNYANCFSFHFNETSICPGRTTCENKAQCLSDRTTCPTSTMCICSECFYGGRCQFTTKTFGLALDVILGYQIRSDVLITRQSVAVKVSIVLTTLMLIVGLLNSVLSTMTFRSKNFCHVGCGLYLLTLSVISGISVVMFVLKFWLLVLSQISWITNRTVLLINCISIEFILRSLLSIGDWLSACVAIERVVVVMRSINFNQATSKEMARWVIVVIVLCILLSLIHDPIHRQLIDDEEEQRTWCIVRYSSVIQIFDSTIHILHFSIPFFVNLISAALIIVMVARTHSIARRQQTYREHLRQQFYQQKHLIISPIILIILALPRLIISFLSGCMTSIREPWLFLAGYFISFTPPLLTSVVFIWPSQTYKKECHSILKRYRAILLRRLHRRPLAR